MILGTARKVTDSEERRGEERTPGRTVSGTYLIDENDSSLSN